jgi:hypothetical protein
MMETVFKIFLKIFCWQLTSVMSMSTSGTGKTSLEFLFLQHGWLSVFTIIVDHRLALKQE